MHGLLNKPALARLLALSLFGLAATVVFVAQGVSRPDQRLREAKSEHTGGEAIPAAGIRLESDGGPVNDGRRFLYEAARSGKFGVVETTERYLQGSPNGIQWHIRHLRFDFVDDLDRCAALPAAPSRSGYPADAFGQQIIQYHFYEEDLASGRCVMATDIDQPTARYVLKPDRTLVDSVTGATLGKLDPTYTPPETEETKLWKAFGLARINASRLDDADRERTGPDNLSDAVLVRTLRYGSDALKFAAARIVEDRLQISERFIERARRGGYGPKQYERRQNSIELGLALLESGLLRSSNGGLRAVGLRAAAAIPSAREQLMPAVMSAMDDIVIPRPLDASERLLTGRLDDVLPGSGGGLFGDRTPRPGSKFASLVDLAALAAARFGPNYAERFVTHYEADIVSALREMTGAQGIALAVAGASSGAKVVNDALSVVDAYNSGYVLWNVAAMLAARPGPPSAETMAVMRSRCDLPTRGSNRRFSALFCDAMGARAGDRAALDRLSQIVVENRPLSTREIYRPADEAAYALLFDAGPACLGRLRLLAVTAEPEVANIALAALCQLGPDAGTEVIARANALADATNDLVTRRQNANCSAPERSNIGRFVDVR